MRQRYSSGMPCGLSGRGGLPEAACAFFGFCLAARRRRRGGATLQARVTGLGTARKLATRFAYMALCWRFRRRGAWRGVRTAMTRGDLPRGARCSRRRAAPGLSRCPSRGRKKCMVSCAATRGRGARWRGAVAVARRARRQSCHWGAERVRGGERLHCLLVGELNRARCGRRAAALAGGGRRGRRRGARAVGHR